MPTTHTTHPNQSWDQTTIALSPPTGRRLLAAIVFADMVGYSKLMDEDEIAAYAARERYRTAVHRNVERYGGDVVQEYGDGALMLFPSAVDAVRASRRIQRELAADDRVSVRIGVHVSDVVRDEAGAYGTGVNVAARIQTLCPPGGVYVSGIVEAELRNKPGLEVRPLGARRIKNIEEPVHIAALVDREADTTVADRGRGWGTRWLAEIRRRKVDRMAGLYLATSLSVAGASELLANAFSLPEGMSGWTLAAAVLVAPLALWCSWMYDLSIRVRPEVEV